MDESFGSTLQPVVCEVETGEVMYRENGGGVEVDNSETASQQCRINPYPLHHSNSYDRVADPLSTMNKHLVLKVSVIRRFH